jgi:ATP-binding cassette subfamily B protein
VSDLGSRRVLRDGMRVLAVGVREEPRVFAVSVAGSTLYAVATIAQAYVLGEVVGRLVLPSLERGDARAGTLGLAAAAIVTVGGLKAAGVVARRIGAGVMQYRLGAAYRRRVTRQYLRLPLAWHSRHSTGELLSNANADVDATWFVIAPFPFAVGTLIMLLGAAVALLVTDPLLAAVGFVVFPAIAFLNVVYNRRLTPVMTRAQQLRAEVSGIAHESFDGALVVKTLGREADETRRFAARAGLLRDALIRAGRERALFDPAMEALPQLGTLAVLLVGTSRVASGAISAGELVSVAYLFTLLAFPVRAIGWVLGELPRATVGYSRLRRVLDAEGAMPFGAATLAAEGPLGVAARGVGFAYPGRPGGPDAGPDAGAADAGPVDAGAPEAGGDSGGRERRDPAAPVRVLDGFDLAVPAGRTVALVGATGAGKSTAVDLLVRLVDPDEGAVTLDRTDARDLAPGVTAGAVALVPQTTFLFDDTVRGNVTLGLDVPDVQVREALRLAQAEGFVDALPQGLDTRVGERGTSLSGGQRQRVALARALVRRPRLLVLDDATSSVDPQVEAAILAGLRDAALPATVVVVAYRRATIALADEVLWVEGGRVAAHGRHDDLVERVPAYAALVSAYEDAAAERSGAAEPSGAVAPSGVAARAGAAA